MSKVNFILVNQSSLPYNITQDYIRLKLTMKIGKRMSQKSGITGTIYGNVGSGGSTAALIVFSTNEYGVAEINIPTNSIPNRSINTCKLWAEGLYLGVAVNSSITRANFIYFPSVQDQFITAGSCDVLITDRSPFNFYDAGNFCDATYDRDPDLESADAVIITRSASWL